MFVLYKAKISGERLQDHWSSGSAKASEQFLAHNFLLPFRPSKSDF